MSYIDLNPEASEYENMYVDIKNYILYSLGYPVVRVELTETMVMQAILDAVNKYYERAAEDYDIRVLVPSGNTVEIPADMNKAHIVDVIFERDFMDSLSSGLALGVYADTLGGVIPLSRSGFNLGTTDYLSQFNMAEYYMYLQKLEDFKTLVGIKRHFDIQGDSIVLYPSGVRYSRIGIVYKPLPDSEYLGQISWIREYALAKAKHMLGTIRAKLSGMSSTGANISADGESLKAEAKEEIATLKEELNQLQRPMPILQG